MANVLTNRPTPDASAQTAPVFRVLGPVRVLVDGTELDLGGRQQRLVLALLLRAAGHPVSVAAVIDGLWPDEPPQSARKTIQVYVHRLRKEIGAALHTEPNGYSVDTGGRLDATEFEDLQREGRAVLDVDPRRAADLLREALGLWNGSAYADMADEPALAPEITRLENLRLAVLGDRIDADLQQGSHDALIGELEGLTLEFPHLDRFRAQHMVALYRSGRQVEALRAYERLRRYLAEEMGLEPSAELANLERRILDRDESLIAESRDQSGSPPAIRGYELRELVGSSLMTDTYRAYHRSVGREVAVRILGADIADDPEFIADFLGHTQRIAALEHPHIVHVFDTWREPGHAYQVSRWLGGGSLEDARSGGRLDRPTGLAVIEQIGGALAYAHREHVVHGRVRESNVLFDNSGNAYLADFTVKPGETDDSTARDTVAFARLAERVIRATGEVASAVAAVFEAADSDEPAYTTVERFLAALWDADHLDDGRSARPAPPRQLLRNPYKGLRAFQESDADDFYGREHLVTRLRDMLETRRLVAIVGPSGSGKSSVMKAGLSAHLRNRNDGRVRLVTEMFPGAFPFEELESALLRVGVDRTSVLDDLLGDERGLSRVLRRILPDVPESGGVELVLMIDQFEELFSAVDDEQTRSLFIANLTNAVEELHSRLRVVLTVRADFFDRPLEYAEFGSLVEAGLVPVTVPDADGLEAAITEPARSVGVELEAGLVPQILRDVGDEPGGLPLLQYALTELFDERESNRLTLETYQRTGGVFGALGRRAEELYSGLDANGQHAIWQTFLRLIAVEEGSNDVRRRVRRRELHAPDIDDRALADALALFGSHRLLTFDLDPVTRGPTVEVAHEALLREWSRLRGWVAEHRDELLVRRRVGAALADWEQADRDPSFLPAGGRLAQFQEWAVNSSLSLTIAEQNFLADAEARESEAIRRVVMRRRWVMIGLIGVAAALAVVAAFALAERRKADDSADRAETARLGAEAVTLAEANPRVGLLLAAEAHRREPSASTLGALQQVMLRTGPFLGAFGNGAVEVEWRGDRIIALTEQGLSVYDAESRGVELEIPLDVRLTPAGSEGTSAHADGVPSVFAASPDGTWAVVGVDGGALDLIDLNTGDRQTLPDTDEITAAEFSNSGRSLAVGTDRGDIMLMGVPNLDDRRMIASVDDERSFADIPLFSFWSGAFPRYESLAFRGVGALAFSANDTVLASSYGPRVRLWSTATLDEVAPAVLLSTRSNAFPHFPQILTFVGPELVAHGFDTITRIDPSTGSVLSAAAVPAGRTAEDLDLGITLRLTGNRALAIVDGGRVIDFDATVDNLADGPVREFSIPSGSNEALAVSPDRRSFVVGGADYLTVWALDGQQLLADALPRRSGRLLSVSSDGEMVAATDGTMSQVFDLSGSSLVAIDVPDALRTAGVASTGRTATLGTHVIAAGSDASGAQNDIFLQYSQGRALFYDGLDFADRATLVQNFDDVSSISPDGELLAHARCTSGDGFSERFGETGETGYLCDRVGVNVVELATGEPVVQLFPDGQASTLDWSADGRRLLHASIDGRVTAWDTESWDLDELGWGDSEGDAVIVRASPDGALLATVDSHGQVSLRDPASGRVRSLLSGSVGLVRALPGPAQGPWFSPDSSQLLSAFDGSIRLWDTTTGEQIGEPFANDIGVRPGGAEGSQLRLVTGFDDHILAWNLDTDSWFDIACRAAGANLTPAEWEQFGPAGTEHPTTCPNSRSADRAMSADITTTAASLARRSNR